MTPKERLLLAIGKNPIDRPPLICPGGMMTMVVTQAMDELDCAWPEAHREAAGMAKLTLGMSTLGGIENLGVPFCMTVEAEGMGADVSLGGKQREPHVTAYPMATMQDVSKLREVDPTQGRARVCCEAIEQLKDQAPHLPIIANLSGPVSLATSLVDPMLYYRALRRDKASAHRLNEISVESALRLGDAMVDAGADVVCIADPSATGDLIGPAAFEEFALPYLNRMSDHFQENRHVPVVVHICGDIGSLGTLPARLTARVVSVDSQVSISQLRRQAGNKATMGNVSTFTLERGTPEKVARAAGVALAQGVDILAPACGISPLTPLENIRSLASLVTEMRQA